MQDLNYGQMSALPTDFVGRSRLRRSKAEAERRWVSGYMNHNEFVLGAGAIKNRDKLIDPTVRVRHRLLIVLV
jgi:hypothetical protein